ncbi:WD40-repeat-containing domain protein [Lactarius sanguifluus]|nr:WD40-repeat-containing domain protein [Lactarius sanguifluus]
MLEPPAYSFMNDRLQVLLHKRQRDGLLMEHHNFSSVTALHTPRIPTLSSLSSTNRSSADLCLIYKPILLSFSLGERNMAPSTPKRTPNKSKRLQAQNRADNMVLPGGALLMSFQLDVPSHDDAGSLAPISENSVFLEELDPLSVPPELKKEGRDWFAIFNPKIKRALDINLVYTLHHKRHEEPVLSIPLSVADVGVAWRQRGAVQIFDAKTGARICILVDNKVTKPAYIRSMCFSPNGQYLATGSEDLQICIWDLIKRRIRNVFDGHTQAVYALDFSPDGRSIVSGSGDRTVRIWDMQDGSNKLLADRDTETADSGVASVAISPDGRLIAVGSLDNIVRIWDVATGQLIERLRGHKDSVYSVAFTPDGDGIVSGSLDKTIKYWDVGKLLTHAPKRDPRTGLPLADRPGSSSSVVKREDDEASAACTKNFLGHRRMIKDYVLTMAVSHDGQWVVSGSKDRGVQFWDPRSAITQFKLQGHTSSIISIDLSPSSLLATGSSDRTVRIWSYDTQLFIHERNLLPRSNHVMDTFIGSQDWQDVKQTHLALHSAAAEQDYDSLGWYGYKSGSVHRGQFITHIINAEPLFSHPAEFYSTAPMDRFSQVVHPLRPSLPGDPSSGTTSHRKVGQGRRKKQKNICARVESYRRVVTIGMLPDNVLLEIFDTYRSRSYTYSDIWEWHLLIHVCQRWRQIVFASPHRLNLRILCTSGTPVRTNLGIWPAFPIAIDYRHSYSKDGITPNDEDNIVATLNSEHLERVISVRLYAKGSQLGKIAPVMQEPFPALTHLHIDCEDGNAPVLPAEFLGGSAPRLQEITLSGIPYLALPTLLLSTSDLVKLELRNIPPTGYIPPEAMVVGLAALPRLETFIIGFQSATHRPDRIRPLPETRTVLPALTYFEFQGASEYLEDLLARIDCPQLDRIFVNYLNQLADFQIAQLSKFIDRSVGPVFRRAQVTFFSDWVSFDMYRDEIYPTSDARPARTDISCQGIDWQVSHMAEVLSQFSTTLSNVVHLRIGGFPGQAEGMGDVEWLHLLHQFSTAQTLHVSSGLAGHVALALEDITAGMVTAVLPSLDSIYLSGQPASSVGKFVAVRRLSGRPVTVIDTETVFDERLKS